MADTTVVEVEHFVVRLELRVLLDFAYVTKIQNVTLFAFKYKILDADFDESIFLIFFRKEFMLREILAYIEVDLRYLLLVSP